MHFPIDVGYPTSRHPAGNRLNTWQSSYTFKTQSDFAIGAGCYHALLVEGVETLTEMPAEPPVPLPLALERVNPPKAISPPNNLSLMPLDRRRPRKPVM